MEGRRIVQCIIENSNISYFPKTVWDRMLMQWGTSKPGQ